MKIPKRARRCCSCKTEFEPGSSYFSSVKGEERNDFCLDCFKEEGIFWRGKIPLNVEHKKDERALKLFRERPEFRLLLALYLERCKELASRPQLSSKEKRCYELLETGELFHVPVGRVQPRMVEEVTALIDA